MAKELLFSVTKKDLEISFFSGTGKGGQNRNKSQACVRLLHRESGATGTGQRERSREQNLREAFETLVRSPKFRTWHAKKITELTKTADDREAERLRLEQEVDAMMRPENILVEVQDEDGNWYAQDDNGDASDELES